MKLALALALAVAACGSKHDEPPPTCESTAAAVDRLIAKKKEGVAPKTIAKLDGLSGKLKALIATACARDKWTPEILACYASPSGSLDSCRKLLPPKQDATLLEDTKELITIEMSSP